MGGWEAQRKCVRCMQGVCCGFCTNFNDSAPSTEFGDLQAVVDVCVYYYRTYYKVVVGGGEESGGHVL
jgi:hypothetical protein